MSMKAEDLRIGNLILRIGNLHEVDWGTIKICAQRNKQFNEDFKPIPLSTEYLERLGFKEHEFDVNYWCIPHYDYAYCLLYREWAKNYSVSILYTDSPDPKDDGAFYSIAFDIEYVHQLQNLYFALTGQELNFVTP